MARVIPVYDSAACHQTVVEGRRVVDISFLCEQLSEGCAFYKHILRLPMVRREVRYGLASSFDIQCEAAGCQALNKVFTSSQHRGSATRGPKVFDVNTKLGLGKESCSALLRCGCVRACIMSFVGLRSLFILSCRRSSFLIFLRNATYWQRSVDRTSFPCDTEYSLSGR